MSSRFTPEDLGKMLGKGNVRISADSGAKGETIPANRETKTRAEVKKQAPLETTEQQRLIQYAANRWVEPEDFFLKQSMFAIPNGATLARSTGGRLQAKQMQKLKAEGLREGASDLFCMLARCDFNFLAVEMKRSTEYFNTVRAQQTALSEDQYKFAHDVQQSGGLYWACFGERHAIEVLERYLSGTLGQQSMIRDYIKRHEGKR